jgi:cytochrome bd ubiquinol oxidase subunit I
MDPTSLSQVQFAATSIYHFFFVPLTLGLSVLVAIFETIYVRTGNETYEQMTKFWGKLFLINFAMGVVTGIVQEFQFGMNWSAYSRFVGDIFGVPLAIEALLAFFLESTFLGLWVFGWDKLSKNLHLTTIWLVAIGSTLSALWILIANSFMQEPVGYAIQNDRAVMTDFGELLSNPNVWVQFPHTVLSGFTTAAFFVMGISAYHMLRKRQPEIFQRSFQIAAILGVISIILVILGGHSQAQHMVQSQPMKMAASEALWESQDPASLSLITIGNEPELKDVFAIRIPRLLSLLAYNRLTGEVMGIKDLQTQYQKTYGPGNYIPPVAVSYWTFRIMVGAGLLMFFIVAYALLQIMRHKALEQFKLFRFFPLAIILPYLANTCGWLMTELGRQPWVVYGLMKTSDAVSPIISTNTVLISLIGFVLIYGVLMTADIYLLAKFARAGAEAEGGSPVVDQAYWD